MNLSIVFSTGGSHHACARLFRFTLPIDVLIRGAVTMVSNPRGEQSIAIAAAFAAIAIVVVVLRIYTRLYMVRATGIEDYFIVAATVY